MTMMTRKEIITTLNVSKLRTILMQPALRISEGLDGVYR